MEDDEPEEDEPAQMIKHLIREHENLNYGRYVMQEEGLP